ncbi:hypothetical protein HS088_TW17G00677 [Tripterygium wilfordii]|uniref:Uncharacterized protein n=1 Tax=Tripterygium wilfordii TaxID=458696 RepID=A0A7J7CGG4_TRIWF|nr:hypothetical protein HS088_TW17G00677 [Tripterygium wilfordii]
MAWARARSQNSYQLQESFLDLAACVGTAMNGIEDVIRASSSGIGIRIKILNRPTSHDLQENNFLHFSKKIPNTFKYMKIGRGKEGEEEKRIFDSQNYSSIMSSHNSNSPPAKKMKLKISQRNTANRAKLVTKHTCGTRSFAEVEESMRDPISGKRPPPDAIWLRQHMKKSKEGELQWSDPISKEVHEKLHDLVVQQEETPPESQLTNDEMLLQVLGQKSGYFRGKGAGTRPPTKRTRYLENMQEEVQRAVDSARESMIESLRADVSNELKAEIRKTVEMELKNDLTEQIQSQFNAMFQARMAAFFGSSSQSDTSMPTRPANPR